MAEDDICMPCEEPVIDKYPPCPLQCRSSKCTAYMVHAIDSQVKPIIWVMGGPGSGKTTQCAAYASKHGCAHFCIGDLLRQEIKLGTNRAKCLETIMKRAELVPTDVVLTILKAAMLKKAPTSSGFLIDGYPRDKHQGRMFDRSIAPHSAIIYLEASEETMKKRMHARAQTAGNPKEDEHIIGLKIKVFEKHRRELMEQYSDEFHKINAEQTKEAVTDNIAKIIDPIMAEGAKKANEKELAKMANEKEKVTEKKESEKSASEKEKGKEEDQ